MVPPGVGGCGRPAGCGPDDARGNARWFDSGRWAGLRGPPASRGGPLSSRPGRSGGGRPAAQVGQPVPLRLELRTDRLLVELAGRGERKRFAGGARRRGAATSRTAPRSDRSRGLRRAPRWGRGRRGRRGARPTSGAVARRPPPARRPRARRCDSRCPTDDIHSPPDFTRSLERSAMTRYRPGSMAAMSPVTSHPSRNFSGWGSL